MQNIRIVDCSSAAEKRFEAACAEVSGRRADVDLEALHALMCDTVALLADIDAALIAKPIIRDHVPRA